MDKTANYSLNKPTYEEMADVAVLNENADLIDTALAGKVDKETGKGLSAEDYTAEEKTKLAGIEAGANNYAHPVTHPPSIIEQDANNQFVSDAEKEAWNAAETNAKAYVGDKNTLLTTAKATVVAAVNELFTNVSDGKNLIAAAITGKGVSASGSDTFPVLAGKIGDIPAGGEYGTATAAQVLSGYTIGTESGIVAGNIPSKGAATITPGTTNQTIAAGQYLSGVQTVVGDANLSPANIKSGVNIFGVSGALSSNSIKSIQHITITLSTGVNSVSTSINSVIPANTIILCNGFHANNTSASPAANFVYFELYNATTVKAYRYQASSTYYAYASAIIIEFAGSSVRSKQIGYLASRQTASIAQVDPAKSILTCAGLFSAETSGTGYWPGMFFNLYLQSNTAIYAGTTTAGSATCYWNLIEFY